MDASTNLITHVWDYFNVSSADRGNKYIEIPNTTRKHFAESLGAYAARTPDRPLRVVEVGSHAGDYAEVLCTAIQPLHLTVVDPYENYDGYGDYGTRNHDKMWHKIQARLHAFNVSFLRMTSVAAAAQCEDGYYDVVYIDANHKFEYVLEDIVAWLPKIRPGGLISGHDYFNSAGGLCQVRAAVESWQRQHPDVRVTTFGQRVSRQDGPAYALDGHARSWCWGVE